MTYELAKKLLDAEFWDNEFLINRRWDLSDFYWNTKSGTERMEREKIWIPALEELIEACGEGIFNLLRQSEWHKQETGFAWKATIAKLDKPFPLTLDNIEKAMIDAYGETAEIAVANLFLALKGLKK